MTTNTVQTWLVSRDTRALLDFITTAFGGTELSRVPTADGGIGHAEIRVGEVVLLAFDSRPDWPELPSMLRVFVADVDATVQRAVAAGARVVTEPETAAWGDRIGRVRDPLGNVWWVAQHVEDVAPEDIGARMQDPRYGGMMRRAQETLDAELGTGGPHWSSAPVL